MFPLRACLRSETREYVLLRSLQRTYPQGKSETANGQGLIHLSLSYTAQGGESPGRPRDKERKRDKERMGIRREEG